MSKFAVIAFVSACITVFGISLLMRDRLCLIVISHGNTVVQTTFSYEE
ncbi:Hok/Gef family protein [Providencia hangzhouensis]|uniref:Hok/Gef family protein n=1 Tax=Providencia rettgeri TaxID=587 RepID=A0AAE2ZIM2_PRORE|nr:MULTISPECIES: Hok/Gef family protein [Providencia]EJD6377104.1 Hok/Gef family protein [Providencia rettgeri]EJF7709871.1 Hok/Gef family protein [Providencia rettgeri]ELR5116384.1 Hok/Gef family protein [Providencia rettgeri]MBG5893847.1 Hok/Gef family protein [Providencia rettgeri]MBI6202681.1 Hok/Gef family protein [Providencia rettgeri]